MEVNDKVKDENIGIEQVGNQVIHVRGNSDSELQALFDCVLDPSSQMPLQKPFKMRNLPASFFVPPAHRQSPAPTVSHSREGSADSTYGSNPGGGTLRVAGTISPAPSPQHFRHHSSPASLQQSLSIAQPPPNVHSRQHSFDALSDEQSALPQGWEEARTSEGQIYYLNHITQSTTWEDPRKRLQPLTPQQQQQQPPVPAPQQQPPVTAPSIQQPQPQPPSSQPPQPQQQLIMAATSSNTNPTTSSTATSASSGGITSAVPSLASPNLPALPEGWEQGVSPDGDIYFINHITKSTSWYDPRIPRNLQTIGAHKLVHNLPPIGRSAINSSAALQRQNASLQRLQQEKERLRLRRQEMGLAQNRIQVDFSQRRTGRDDTSLLLQSSALIQQQRQQPQQQISSISQVPSSTLASLVSSANSLPSSQASSVELTFTSADPFMATSDFHSRQESADSGLGLGSNYTHPHTPEDFLAAMEDVEITPSGELKHHHSSSPMIVGSELESMDSEDLVPSITINDEISAEFLNDMLEPTKLENLPTWL